MTTAAEMPRYRSHKVVHALKIGAMEIYKDGSVKLQPADPAFAALVSRPGFAARMPGEKDYDDPGYFVVYEDGYQSWSPTKAFEEGYSLITDVEPLIAHGGYPAGGSGTKFRKKPVVIDAVQYVPGGQSLVESWMIGHGAREQFGVSENGIQIHTLEGVMTASPGDWIIRGVKGEFYPCKPDIFAATYEPEGE